MARRAILVIPHMGVFAIRNSRKAMAANWVINIHLAGPIDPSLVHPMGIDGSQ